MRNMDEDTKIEFKYCDPFNQNLDRVFGEMANLRRELSESTKRIEVAEDLIKEVTEVLERSRRLLENTSHDSEESERVQGS